VALGAGMMVLLLLALTRHNLGEDWRTSLPADLPNYFFINIAPAARAEFAGVLEARGARAARMVPMIRRGVTAVDGRPVESQRFAQDEGDLAQREQNLTWTGELGADNRVVAGRWWTAADAGRPLVSVATEFQKALGLSLGDRLTFDIAGEAFTAAVA